MNDLRNRMERLGDRALVEQGAFERLERRRRRKERSRRIGAGAVAFIVMIAGSLTAFAVFRDTEARVAGEGGAESFLAIWPESSYEDALAVQQAVEAGDQSLAWRLDADETALAFARDALGWPEAQIDPSVATFGDGTWVAVRTPPLPMPCPSPSVPSCDPREATIELRQHFASSGIWSVVAVRSDAFDLRVAPGEQVALDEFVAISTTLAEGTEVAVGVAGTGSCSGFYEQTAEVIEGNIVLAVQGVGEGCAGYLYALTPSTPVGQVELGKIMFVYHEPKPALGYTIEAIAAVPVRFVSAEGEPPSVSPTPVTVAKVTCDGSNTSVDTPVVAAQPDGVHIDIFNAGEEPLSVSWEFGAGEVGLDGSVTGAVEGAGDNVDPGAMSTVLTFVPGSYVIVCHVPGVGEVTGMGPVEVIDPAGYYVPAELDCVTGEAYGSGGDYPGGTTGFAGDPVQVARDHVSGLEFDDLVERAGYPESEQPVIRVVRDGAVVGKVTLRSDGAGGWLDDTIEGCGGTLFGWSDELTGVSGPVGPSGVSVSICGPIDTYLHLVGSDLQFDDGCLAAPSMERIHLLFTNLDEGVPRNVSIYVCTSWNEPLPVPECVGPQLHAPLFTGEIIDGTRDGQQIEIVYEIPALEPGIYYFQDDVHPAANGVLIVELAR